MQFVISISNTRSKVQCSTVQYWKFNVLDEESEEDEDEDEGEDEDEYEDELSTSTPQRRRENYR